MQGNNYKTSVKRESVFEFGNNWNIFGASLFSNLAFSLEEFLGKFIGCTKFIACQIKQPASFTWLITWLFIRVPFSYFLFNFITKRRNDQKINVRFIFITRILISFWYQNDFQQFDLFFCAEKNNIILKNKLWSIYFELKNIDYKLLYINHGYKIACIKLQYHCSYFIVSYFILFYIYVKF